MLVDRVLYKLHHTPPPAAVTHHPFTSPIITTDISGIGASGEAVVAAAAGED